MRYLYSWNVVWDLYNYYPRYQKFYGAEKPGRSKILTKRLPVNILLIALRLWILFIKQLCNSKWKRIKGKKWKKSLRRPRQTAFRFARFSAPRKIHLLLVYSKWTLNHDVILFPSFFSPFQVFADSADQFLLTSQEKRHHFRFIEFHQL